MKKILWFVVLSLVIIFCAIGFIACDDNGSNSGNTPDTPAHTHAFVDLTVDPTCTTGGYTLHKCSCGEEYKDTYTDALGHNYVDGKCTVCKTVDPNYGEPADPEHTHNFIPTVVPPTCTEQGYTLHKCSCGEEYKDTYTDALEHDYAEGVCRRCNAIDPDYVQFTDADYKAWKSSAQAEDFNGDRIITQDDYKIYLVYKAWKGSDYAYDYNGDRLINYDDYLFAKKHNIRDLETWLNSDDAYDYNADGFIDKYDFGAYIKRADLIGEFKIINFAYQTSPLNGKIYLDNSGYGLHDLVQDIDGISFEISKDLELNCKYDDTIKEKLGEDNTAVQNAINSCEFDMLSDNVITATFNINYLDFTVYLEKTEDGFSSSINCTISDITVQISFDILYVK